MMIKTEVTISKEEIDKLIKKHLEEKFNMEVQHLSFELDRWQDITGCKIKLIEKEEDFLIEKEKVLI